MHPAVAKDMRRKGQRLEDGRKGDIANAQTAGIGTERRHHRALPIAGETSPFHGTAARRDTRLRMQVSCDFAHRAGRLMTKYNRSDRNFVRNNAAEIAGQ